MPRLLYLYRQFPSRLDAYELLKLNAWGAHEPPKWSARGKQVFRVMIV